MANVIRAAWDDLHAVIAGAHEQVFICTPYYTDEGLAHLLDHLQSPVELVFVTRLSPPDWARGVSDPEALAVLLELLQGEGRDASLVVHQRLHAKAYLV